MKVIVMPQQKSLFSQITPAPADAILGLTEAFKADPRPGKVNLAVGVYKDETGQTPTLNAVREAEARLNTAGGSKSYLPIDGDAQYDTLCRALILGADHPKVLGHAAVTAQTPGGTGGLRVAADFLKDQADDVTIHLPDPTWANHGGIFAAAGLLTSSYAYYDPATFSLDFDAMLDALSAIPAGDVVLLHGCCHNPTGVDLTPEQWQTVAETLAERGLLPLIDFAYQGFGLGITEDAVGLRTVIEHVPEAIIVGSCSKNFGLYNERVGSITFVAADADAAAAVLSQVKTRIRTNYSNPPAHGAQIVRTILNDPTLRHQWEEEVAGMRMRIHGVREQFAQALDKVNVKLAADGNAFLARQQGMFSFTGLTKGQVAELKEQHAIYMVGSGRINVAGITPPHLEPLAQAIAAVV